MAHSFGRGEKHMECSEPSRQKASWYARNNGVADGEYAGVWSRGDDATDGRR